MTPQTDAPTPTPLLPPILRKPLLLLWTLLLPQAVLVALNLRAWQLVKGDVSAEQARTCLLLFAFELLLLAGGAGLAATLAVLRRRLTVPTALPLLALHIGFLAFVTMHLNGLLPASVTLWMLPESEILFYQFALCMPAAFHAGLVIACFETRLPRGWDIAASVFTLVGVPAGIFLMAQLSRWFFGFGGRHHHLEEGVLLVGAIAATALVLLAFLRVLLWVYGATQGNRLGQLVLAAAAGLAAPLGGLLLNRAIPFPYDFQSVPIYAFTIVNGLVLLLPTRPGGSGLVRTWALRAACYPFTLYFFFVFLPFTPLSLLAMLAFGAGFLILAPTLLFVTHTRRLYEEARLVAAQLGVSGALALGLVCVALLPGAFVVRALYDKTALGQALDYVYSRDYRANEPPPFSLSAARRALERQGELKNGLYLPFLSDAYNALVFNGMVLPDQKIQALYAALYGETLDLRREAFPLDFFGGRSRSGDWAARNGRVTPPPRDVALADVAMRSAASNGIARTDVTLTLRNNAGAGAEFRTDCEIPTGVFVTGFWLDVAGTNVPGRIFEKKAALWVYHMIRDVTRRDPGLLVYRSATGLRLSVFPFEPAQTRTVGLSLRYPATLAPTVKIGDRTLQLEPPAGAPAEATPAWRYDSPDGSATLVLTPQALAALPAFTRERYLHFMCDASLAAAPHAAAYAGRLRQAATRFPDVKRGRVTFVNYRSDDRGQATPEPLAEVAARLAAAPSGKPSFTGGFDPRRAIKHALLMQAAEGDAGCVPVFVVLRAPGAPLPETGEDLSGFVDLAPDAPAYYELNHDSTLWETDFATGTRVQVQAPAAPRAVRGVTGGLARRFVRADAGSAVLRFDRSPDTCAGLADAQGARVPTPLVCQPLPAGDTYTEALALWQRYARTVVDPGALDRDLPELVARSRATGVLLPVTSYMVVEQAAQWEILARKEGQALGAHHALEFDEGQKAPAPSALLLAPFVLFLAWRAGGRRGARGGGRP